MGPFRSSRSSDAITAGGTELPRINQSSPPRSTSWRLSRGSMLKASGGSCVVGRFQPFSEENGG